MNFRIFLKQDEQNCVHATILEFPNIQVKADNRFAAIEAARCALNDHLHGGEIVETDLSGTFLTTTYPDGQKRKDPNVVMMSEHPTTGMFQDDPTWDEFLEMVAEYRAEHNKVPDYED